MLQCIAGAHSKSRTQHPTVEAVSTSTDTKSEPKNIVAQRAEHVKPLQFYT
jgi:hypothetical protein